MIAALPRPRIYGNIIDPSTLPSCRLALDFSLESYTNGQQITTVTDRSGHGLTFTQPGTANLVYETNAVNGLGVADFRGTDSYLVAASAADWTWMKTGSAFHIIALFYATEANPNRAGVILDNAGFSSSNHGITFAYDDRQASSINKRLTGLVGSGASLHTGTPPDNSVQPQVWTWVEMTWQGRLHGGGQHGDVLSALGLWAGGLSNDAITSTATVPTSTVASAALNIGRTKDSTFYGVFKLGCLFIFDRILDEDSKSAVMLYNTRKWKVGYNRIVCQGDYSGNSGFIRLPDKTYAAVYSHKSMHAAVLNSQQLYMKRSPDGWHWNTGLDKLVLGYTAGASLQPGGMLCRLSSGTMLCGGFTTLVATPVAAVIQRSTNGGRTWAAASVTTGYTTWSAFQTNFLELSDGSILAGVYGLDTGGGQITYSKVLRSSDDGATWTVLSTLHNGNGGDAKAVNEVCLVKVSGTYPNETIFAIFRNETDASFNKKTSTDSGSTWSARAAMLTGVSAGPHVIQAASGKWFVTCRASTTPYRGLIYWSADNGATWSTTPYWLSSVNGFSHYAAGFEVEAGYFAIFHISQWDENLSTITIPNTSTGYVSVHREADIILHT